MSAFTDPSSIILILGALFIIIFLVHGLWFSNKPNNRRLKKNDQRDQEISNSEQIGKVRIVTPDSFHTNSEDEALARPNVDPYIGTAQQLAANAATTARKNSYRSNTTPNFDTSYSESLNNSASISVNPQTHNIQPQVTRPNIDELPPHGSDHPKLTTTSIGNDQHNIYEIIIVAAPDRPFMGEDFEEICNQYGFIQGYIQDNLKIYFVYENAREKTNEVFRICSMEPPYYFPEKMSGYQTSAIALYMTLPPQGKALAYFRALRMATEIFINRLGGHMEDQHQHQLTNSDLDALAAELQAYDNGSSESSENN